MEFALLSCIMRNLVSSIFGARPITKTYSQDSLPLLLQFKDSIANFSSKVKDLNTVLPPGLLLLKAQAVWLKDTVYQTSLTSKHTGAQDYTVITKHTREIFGGIFLQSQCTEH